MKLKSVLLSAVIAAASIGAASASHAETLLFTYTGAFSATFKIDSAPTPSFASSGVFFDLSPVSGTYNGSPVTFSDAAFADAGGLSNSSLDFSGNFAQTIGPQLFSGTDAHPTFAPVSYTGLGVSGQVNGVALSGTENLTITAVPEPSTWALMLAGIGGLGLAIRLANKRGLARALAA